MVKSVASKPRSSSNKVIGHQTGDPIVAASLTSRSQVALKASARSILACSPEMVVALEVGSQIS